ncbi:MAG: hypothetical protein ACI8Y8_002087, partial [Planctomycetota bacterium]
RVCLGLRPPQFPNAAPWGQRARSTTRSRIDAFWLALHELSGLEAWLLGMRTLKRAPALAALVSLGILLVAGGTLLVVRALTGATGALMEVLGDRSLRLHVAVAHVVVMAVLLVLVFTNARPQEPQGPVARQAWRQFRRGWTLLWCSWLALYSWLGLYWSMESAGVATWSRWGPPVADLLNVVTAAAFFYLFLVLDRPSVKADGLPERDRTFRRSLVGVAIVCGATALLSILGRFEWFGLEAFGPLMGSLLVAISMAFFVGRLSDSHLQVRRALLAPLYFYVAIQVLWHLSVMQEAAGEVANALVLCGALALKIYLFALVTRWIQDGQLQRYFDEVAFPRLPSDLDRS